MGRRLTVLVFASLIVSACYKSHELGDDGGIRHDLGRGVCVPGANEPVPCGRCGTAYRLCMPDATWGGLSACTGETETCGLDVMLLADVTGSHTGVFQSSADALSNELIIPLGRDADTRVGVSAFADYPFGGYGSSPDVPFIGVLPPTHDVGAVTEAVRHIMFLGGVDQPESEIEGLNDLAGGVPHPTAVPFHCTSGVGGGCWRAAAAWRVIIVMTDTASHSLPGPSGNLVEPYGTDLSPPAPDWDVVRSLLLESGTYVYWIVPNDSGGSGTGFVSAAAQAYELARQLGEDPLEAVTTYDGGTTTGAIAQVRERVITHFGLHTSGP